MPEPPGSGIFSFARYFIAAVHGRYLRGAAERRIRADISGEVTRLDGVLGELGRAARVATHEGRPFADEHKAIDAASGRAEGARQARGDIQRRLAEEGTRHQTIAGDLTAKLGAAEKEAAEAGTELDRHEAERARTRDHKKNVDRRQKVYIKGAQQREAQAAKAATGDERSALRRSAEDLRSDAARIEPERAELERSLIELDEKVKVATARNDAARAALEATRKAVEDATAGHRHRRAELEAEEAQKVRLISDAESEIARRMVTLGTLVNLNRVNSRELDPLYGRIDTLKLSIANREKEVERLETERRQIDRGAIIRGAIVLGGAFVIALALICVLVAIL